MITYIFMAICIAVFVYINAKFMKNVATRSLNLT